MTIDDITFDESDKNLFQVDDARLRADALKHSILPRLHVVMNECISTIRSVYDVEVLDDSIISWYPRFRVNRNKDLKLLYNAAYVGIGGARTKSKWCGIERKDAKPVQILHFRLGLHLTVDGLSIYMNHWFTRLTDASFEKYLNFHLKFEDLTHTLCHRCCMQPTLYWGEECEPISPFRDYYRHMAKNRLFDNEFMSRCPSPFPITSASLKSSLEYFVLFYPIYDSYIQISKDEPVRFLELIDKANRWLRVLEENQEGSHGDRSAISAGAIQLAREAAEQRVKVMPAIRWQVFQRDNWNCVSCGRGSQHNRILHVDHILPRSKGGKDTLDNYQTLCDLCNLGKSNRDETNLRARP